MKRLRAWVPPLAWMGLIFWLSSRPDVPTLSAGWLDQIVKNSGHIFLYFVLAMLLDRAWRLENLQSGTRVPVVLVIALLYALSDEWHQSFVPGRSPSLADVGFDMVGATLAVLFRARTSVPDL
ncbi:MAG: VanZ family protein [Ardenticatenia bacterium]|nr:VanZ family protein [Ardenticatenia bacterium]